MKAERSCIHPFINKIQKTFAENGSYQDCLELVPRYQRLAKRIYQVDVWWIHAAAISKYGLTSFVTYEYLRHKGVPLPDSLKVINSILPYKLFSEKKLLKHTSDSRHVEIDQQFSSF